MRRSSLRRGSPTLVPPILPKPDAPLVGNLGMETSFVSANSVRELRIGSKRKRRLEPFVATHAGFQVGVLQSPSGASLHSDVRPSPGCRGEQTFVFFDSSIRGSHFFCNHSQRTKRKRRPQSFPSEWYEVECGVLRLSETIIPERCLGLTRETTLGAFVFFTSIVQNLVGKATLQPAHTKKNQGLKAPLRVSK